jgi:hypothetical protein
VAKSLIDSVGGKINYIDIDQVIIKRGDIYKPTKPLELVTNQTIVGIATYRFYLRQVTKTTALTDYGIFKRVKIITVPNIVFMKLWLNVKHSTINRHFAFVVN